MNERDKETFQNAFPHLLNHLEPRDVIPTLLADGQITEDDYEKITSISTRKQRVVEFHRVAKSKVPSLETLNKALQSAGYQQLESSSCTKLQIAIDYLKEFYISDTEQMRADWKKLGVSFPDEQETESMYIDLEIMREGKREDRKIDSYQKLFGFRSGYRQYKTILLEGDPGMGKTAYVHKLVRDWSSKVEQTEEVEWLKHQFDLVILVRLGKLIKEDSLEGYLKKFISAGQANAVLKQIESGEGLPKILFVLDGYDEMPLECPDFNEMIMKQKWHGNPLSLCTFLVTSRISHSEKIGKNYHVTIRSHGLNLAVVAEKFSSRIKNLDSMMTGSQKELCQNPLILGLAAALGELPEEVFDLMTKFKRMAVERLNKIKLELSHTAGFTNVDALAPVLEGLAMYAFHAIGEKVFSTLQFNVPWLKETLTSWWKEVDKMLDKIHDELQAAASVGLLWPLKSPPVTFSDEEFAAKLNQENLKPRYTFPHQLFAEFFTALFIAQNKDYFMMMMKAFTEVADKPRLQAWSNKMFCEPLFYFFSGFAFHKTEDAYHKEFLIEIPAELDYPNQLVNMCLHEGQWRLSAPWLFRAKEIILDYPLREKTEIGRQGNPPNISALLSGIMASKNESQLAVVKQLVLHHMNVDESVTNFVRSFREMKKLTLGDSTFNNDSSDHWDTLFAATAVQLQSLDVINVTFESLEACKCFIESLSKLKNLSYLHLNQFHVDQTEDEDKLPTAIQSCLKGLTNLNQLIFYNCGLKRIDFTQLPRSLKNVKIGSTKFSSVMTYMADTELTELELSSCEIDSFDFKALPLSLKVVHLVSVVIRNSNPVISFGEQSRLEQLFLENCQNNLDFTSLPDSLYGLVLVDYGPELKMVDFLNLKLKYLRITGGRMDKLSITELPPMLEKLSVSGLNLTGEKTINLDLTNLLVMEEIFLTDCKIDQTEFGQGQTNLKKLTIDYCDISHQAMINLQNFRRAHQGDVEFCIRRNVEY